MRVLQKALTAGVDGSRSLSARMRAMLADRSGNFGLMFALSAVPVLIALGCSFDYVQALNTQRRMQSAIDAALVVAVKKVGTSDNNALKTELANWVNVEAAYQGEFHMNPDDVQINIVNSTITARVDATIPTTFLKIAGIQTIPVAVRAGVVGGKTVTKTAFSMYLVLDRSTSMKENTNTSYTTTCSNSNDSCTKIYTKIEALKLAVSALMTQLATADPDKKYVRTGAVSYNNAMQTPTALDWGETGVSNYVTNLRPSGTTDSSDAIATAYAALTSGTEETEHNKKSGAKPQKYIVFMTDGANNVANADTKTKATCDAARTNNVRVYTIAFMAPAEGQALLKYCATSAADYFPAESTADIIAAFATIGETSSNNLIRLTQ